MKTNNGHRKRREGTIDGHRVYSDRIDGHKSYHYEFLSMVG